MRHRVVADLSALPLHGSGSSSQTWWGTLAFMLIEGMGFALAIGVYLYLYSLAPHWPIGAPPPDPVPGGVIALLLLASTVPNLLVARWAKRQDLRRVRIGLVIMSVAGVLPLIVRIWEFPALNVSWDSNAYGSVVWLVLGLHTLHMLTDVMDTLVLMAVMFSRHGDNRRRYGDVEDNSLYWYFVVLTWLPIYALLYGVPRL
ncbi:cytochrome C oxidase subunit III [Roseomonas sp. KE2513]|uniref:cytochrome c oxidase subunit 3 n=1 Tax=Roseomonas sp. KE2513 TaxID=2479202 RepID=UPI0028149EE7|nr:cytochrome c oxidase subunit 3 [Roseomonas sp. KE2513]MBI0539118.1 cytochrome C oxidase subunit III [Roseomonas sp. KE2513]